MLMSIDKNNKLIVAHSQLKIDGDIFCPYCNTKTIFKNGTINIPHFAHKEKTSCIYSEYVKEKCGTGGESKEHLEYKLFFKEELEKLPEVESVELEKKIGNRIADIVVYFNDNDNLKRDKAIIEIQLSRIQLKTIQNRTEEYISYGYKEENIYWLFGEKNKNIIDKYGLYNLKNTSLKHEDYCLSDFYFSSFSMIKQIIFKEDIKNDCLIIGKLYRNMRLVKKLINENDYKIVNENIESMKRIFNFNFIGDSNIFDDIIHNSMYIPNYQELYKHINIILDIFKKYPILDDEEECENIYYKKQKEQNNWFLDRVKKGKELQKKYFNMTPAEKKKENENIHKVIVYIIQSIYGFPSKNIEKFYKYYSYRDMIINLKNIYGFTTGAIAHTYLYIEKVKKLEITDDIELKNEIINSYEEAKEYYTKKKK